MTPLEIVAIIALVGYAIYRQSRRHEIVGSTRFRLAILYGVVGVVVLADGGFSRPEGAWEIGLLAVSVLLSVVVGLMRGRLSRVWAGGDGRVYSQGTPLTVGLFLG